MRTTAYGTEFEDTINQLPDTMQQLGQMQQQVQQGQQQTHCNCSNNCRKRTGAVAEGQPGQGARENIETQAGAAGKAASSARQQADALETMQRVQLGQVLPLAR